MLTRHKNLIMEKNVESTDFEDSSKGELERKKE